VISTDGFAGAQIEQARAWPANPLPKPIAPGCQHATSHQQSEISSQPDTAHSRSSSMVPRVRALLVASFS